MPDSLSALVITYNEATNIARCLERLDWVQRVVVLDSGSTDGTQEIARNFPNVEVIERAFDTFAGQCNFGLNQIHTDWVLSLDADYILGKGFEEAARAAIQSNCAPAFRVPFQYCIHGQGLSATVYPPRIALYRRDTARYEDEGHGHRVCIKGTPGLLGAMIDHDDRKPLSRWFASQIKYSEQEAEFLATSAASQLSRMDKLRAKAWIVPVLTPFYCLIVKGLWRDGRAGWHYTLQRWVAECMIALALVDRRFAKASKPGQPDSP